MGAAGKKRVLGNATNAPAKRALVSKFVAESTAAEHGKTVKRAEWRLVIPTHVAESREQAWAEAGEGAVAFQAGYREETLGIPRGFEGRREDVARDMVERGNSRQEAERSIDFVLHVARYLGEAMMTFSEIERAVGLDLALRFGKGR